VPKRASRISADTEHAAGKPSPQQAGEEGHFVSFVMHLDERKKSGLKQEVESKESNFWPGAASKNN